MKFLTTNSAGRDSFGGIHTRKLEHTRHSPEHDFCFIELNGEKKYASDGNVSVHTLNTEKTLGEGGILKVFEDSLDYSDFKERVEDVVLDYQRILSSVNPDIVLIPGTSATSYFLFEACKRENMLNRAILEYSGILEREIDAYEGSVRKILESMGKEFVSEEALDNLTYMFNSQICKNEVEKIHNVEILNAHVIWNGISEEFIEGGFDRSAPKDLILGYVGRVHHVKNMPFFLKLSEKLPNVKLKVVTDLNAGRDKESSAVLAEMIKDGKAICLPPTNKTGLKEFYSKEVSVGVVSSHFETYCNAALESAVAGTPTLLSDKAGACEVFRHYGLDDLIFSPSDMNSFNAALEAAKRRNFVISEDLAKKIYNDLSWKNVIKKYNEIAKEVANKRMAVVQCIKC